MLAYVFAAKARNAGLPLASSFVLVGGGRLLTEPAGDGGGGYRPGARGGGGETTFSSLVFPNFSAISIPNLYRVALKAHMALREEGERMRPRSQQSGARARGCVCVAGIQASASADGRSYWGCFRFCSWASCANPRMDGAGQLLRRSAAPRSLSQQRSQSGVRFPKRPLLRDENFTRASYNCDQKELMLLAARR